MIIHYENYAVNVSTQISQVLFKNVLPSAGKIELHVLIWQSETLIPFKKVSSELYTFLPANPTIVGSIFITLFGNGV